MSTRDASHEPLTPVAASSSPASNPVDAALAAALAAAVAAGAWDAVATLARTIEARTATTLEVKAVAS